MFRIRFQLYCNIFLYLVPLAWSFHNAGFKFDETEAAAADARKKYQKAALGLQDSDDEDVEGDLDQQIETMFAAKKIVKEIKVWGGFFILFDI